MKLLFALSILIFANFVYAQDRSPRGEAQWMLERITGVKWPADTALIDQMAALITAGDRLGAAELAVQRPQFLNVTIKQLAAEMSTREETLKESFNDFQAAFIGVTRDNRDARELLNGNFYYRGNPANAAITENDLATDILGSNSHYLQLSTMNADLSSLLVRVEGQQIVGSQGAEADDPNSDDPNVKIRLPANVVPNPDPAGVLTSRAFLGAHAIAGTNRRLVEYTFREFMCLKMENWADTSAPDIRIGRDISRAPGGDPSKFQTSCKGCHTQMDSFRGAFAKWDFAANNVDGVGITMQYVGISQGPLAPGTNNGVVTKLNRPTFIEYPNGFVSANDSWINNSNRGTNATRFGWSGANVDSGNGANAFGNLVANSRRFTECMAQRAWAKICKHTLPQGEVETLYVSLGLGFAQKNYNMRELYKAVAAHPKCRM